MYSLLRVLVVGTLLVLLYWSAPLGQRLESGVLAGLAGALLALVLVTGIELRSIVRSSYPEVRAIEAVGTVLPLALLPFSAAYYAMSHATVHAFGSQLSRLDALYFTITTFATVGYGDIVPKSEQARAVVTVQMLVDLILIGLIAKLVFGAAQRRRSSLGEVSGNRAGDDADNGTDNRDDNR